MLSIYNLEKSFGSQLLFEGATLQMDPGERLGLVGRNGYGKSTLFKMVLGELQPDEGKITFPKNYRTGHLAQHLHFTEPNILMEACLGLPEGEEHDHYKAERILFGLGFTEADMEKAPAEFSGGFQIRLNLAKVLVSNPNLLLLDEPTNYLDIISIRWLTKFLRAWKNEMILISHDREFLDSVTTHTALIHRHKIRKVKGPTEKIYALVEQDEEIYEKTRLNQEKQRKHTEAFINRFRAQATKAAAVQSRVKLLEKLPQQEKLSQIQDLDFQFHYADFPAKTLMQISEVSFAYDPEIPLIENLTCQIHAKDRIAIIGKNGKGKSTLLNVLAGELKPTTGEIKCHPNQQLGYFGQTNIQRLSPNLTVEQEIGQANPALGRTQVRTLCGLMMFSGDHAEKKVSNLSGGEKSRVLLGKILAAPANLLFLDEPTNHLDMESIEALIESIENFPGAVVTVTHSEEILRRVATKLIIFHHGRVEVFPGNYDEFLEKIGWEEEGGAVPSTRNASSNTTQAPKPNLNKKELRKQRSEILSQRSKMIDPLKKEIASLESEIDRLETEVKATNQELAEASAKQDVNTYVALSKKIAESQKQIEEKFSQLEKQSQKLEQQSQKFEELLRGL